MIDSIQRLAPVLHPRDSEYDALGKTIRALARLGLDTDTAIIGLSERNRSALNSGNRRHAGAGHRGLDYYSEMVWALDRQDDEENTANWREGRSYRVTLSVEKNRVGEGSPEIELQFNPQKLTFTEAASDARRGAQEGALVEFSEYFAR